MVLRFDDLGMQHRMDAIGEIIMEQGYPTILCLQAIHLIPATFISQELHDLMLQRRLSKHVRETSVSASSARVTSLSESGYKDMAVLMRTQPPLYLAAASLALRADAHQLDATQETQSQYFS